MNTRHRLHQGSDLPSVVSKRGDGLQKEWKVTNVY
jgi:hypothetical protein